MSRAAQPAVNERRIHPPGPASGERVFPPPPIPPMPTDPAQQSHPRSVPVPVETITATSPNIPLARVGGVDKKETFDDYKEVDIETAFPA